MSFKDTLKKLSQKKNLTVSEMETAMDTIVGGKIIEEDIISFLTLLRDKGETSDEIVGAVNSLRKHAQHVVRCETKTKDLLDTCGTGGDGKHTFNISTAAAFVIAGAGIPIAKHGNRAVSSVSGSADVLKALGVNIEASPERTAVCIDKIGIGFLFAPFYRPILQNVAGIRKKIGTKTIFNILGPLMNPMFVKKQLIGVYDEKLLRVVAEALEKSGVESAAIVHGDDGLDEITMATTSQICFVKNGKISVEVFDPKSVGYDYCLPKDLAGGTPDDNAKRLRKTLKGHSEPIDHCVHLNAALGILVYGKATDFKDALLMAQESISSGKAFQKLEQLVEMTNQ